MPGRSTRTAKLDLRLSPDAKQYFSLPLSSQPGSDNHWNRRPG